MPSPPRARVRRRARRIKRDAEYCESLSIPINGIGDSHDAFVSALAAPLPHAPARVFNAVLCTANNASESVLRACRTCNLITFIQIVTSTVQCAEGDSVALGKQVPYSVSANIWQPDTALP